MTDNRFSKKDYFTLGFSFFALIVSFAGFYYNNLKVDDNLQVEFLNENFGPLSLIKKTNGDLQLILLNAGNRPGVVLNVRLDFSATDTDTSNFNFGLQHLELFPMILQPHEIRLIDFKIPYPLLIYDTRLGNYFINDSTGHNEAFALGIQKRHANFFMRFFIESMDSKARCYQITTPRIFSCELDNSGSVQSIGISQLYYAEHPVKMALFSE